MNRGQPRNCQLSGVGSLLVSKTGEFFITGGTTGTVRYHYFNDEDDEGGKRPSIELEVGSGGERGITSLSISKDSNSLAVSSQDREIRLFRGSTYPHKFEASLGREQFNPANALAFNPAGTVLASGASDGSIKLHGLLAPGRSQPQKLTGHTDAIKHLAFDANGATLASSSCDGTLRIWSLESDMPKEVVKLDIFERCDQTEVSGPLLTKFDWRPDGRLLAVPTEKTISVYEPGRWETVNKFSYRHAGNVAAVAFSENGIYLASVSVEGEVFVWDVVTMTDVVRLSLDKTSSAQALGIHWAPGENALVLLMNTGVATIWRNVVPRTRTGPCDSVSDLGLIKAPPAADEWEIPDDVIEAIEAAESQEADKSKKRGSEPAAEKSGEGGESLDVQETEAGVDDDEVDGSESEGSEDGLRGALGGDMQPAFQPSSTPMGARRRILAWNIHGHIVTRTEATFSSIDIEFANKSVQRPVRLTDHYNFILGSLGEHGALFAAESSDENAGVIFYRSFDSWATNSDWTKHLPSGEEPTCLAVGKDWAAAATSSGFVRIFSTAGVQTGIITLPGEVVSMVGFGSYMAVAHHSGPVMEGNQHISFQLMDMTRRTLVHSGRVPLSEGATLFWIGFSTLGVLMKYDSAGLLAGLTVDYGGQWVPLWEHEAKAQSREFFWPVAVAESDMMAVRLRKPIVHPSSFPPMPVLHAVKLKVPMMSTGSAAVREESYLRQNLFLNSVMASRLTGEDDIIKRETAVDQELLRLFNSAVAADRQAMALGFVLLLSLRKSCAVAAQLAHRAGRNELTDRIETIILSKFGEEAQAYSVRRVENTYEPDVEADRVQVKKTDEANTTVGVSSQLAAEGKSKRPAGSILVRGGSQKKRRQGFLPFAGPPKSPKGPAEDAEAVESPKAKPSSPAKAVKKVIRKTENAAAKKPGARKKGADPMVSSNLEDEGNSFDPGASTQLSSPVNPFSTKKEGGGFGLRKK